MTAKISNSVSQDDDDNARSDIDEELEVDADSEDESPGHDDHDDRIFDDYSDFDSEAGDKEDNTPQVDKARVTAVHIEILQQVDAGKYALKTEADREVFLATYQREYVMGKNNEGDSLLHGLLVNVKEEDDLVFNRRIPLLKLLLDLDPKIPIWTNDRHETALYVAVHKQLRKVVEYLCTRSDAAVDALGIPKTNGDTCLHVAIQKGLNFRFLSFLIDKISKGMLLQRGEGGNTPLHLAVEFERCRKGQVDLVTRLVETSRTALEIKNNENLSPFQYHLLTRKRSDPIKRSSASSTLDASRTKKLGSKESYAKYAESKHDLKHNDRSNKDAPEMLKTKSDGKKRRTVPKVSANDAKPVEAYLMLQCMHIADREKAIDVLYGPVQRHHICIGYEQYPDTPLERAIEFDLWGRSSISDADLTNMEAYLKFEVILQYVAIPKLSVMRTPSSPSDGWLGRKLPDCKGRVDYCLIFDWLRECGVEQILRIIIQDDQSLAHSDEIIELALQDFKIEDWDWQKTDICSETILKAAPDVKSLHLYSSGNNAVLRSWSGITGLARLENLETVHLIVSQGLESIERTIDNVREFKARMEKNCKKVKIIEKVIKLVGSTQDTTASEKQQAQDKQKQRWLDCMDGFAKFIQNYPKEPQEKIKVALIDDGVDTTFQELSRNINSGVSYYKRANGLYSSYYQSSGGHGTIMASLIRRVCPHVRIYVAKLDEKLTAGSAAKAVRWATTMGVHIISMSWTIQKTTKNAKEIEELDRAITDADKKDILLFCSASDQGNTAKKDQNQSYPAKCKPDKFFQIGAATASGKGWEWIGHGQVDFIFPGEKLLLQSRLGVLPETLSGSSLATALAAGLAALILYCAEVHNHSDLALLKNYERMKEAFNAIGVSEGYLLVWDTFETSPEEYRSEEIILRTVVTKLLSKSMYGLGRSTTTEFK